MIADLVLLGVVLAVARRGADKLGAATLGIRRTAFWPAVGWMVLTYFAVIRSSTSSGSWSSAPAACRATRPAAAARPRSAAVVLVALGVAVAAPIVEEITFRGYLFPALARWRGPWIGALVCAIVFGLAHCAVYPPELLPMMAVFGFVACMLFWFTGSLLPCVALHAMNNALVTGRDLGWGWEVPLLMLGLHGRRRCSCSCRSLASGRPSPLDHRSRRTHGCTSRRPRAHRSDHRFSAGPARVAGIGPHARPAARPATAARPPR